MELQISNTLFVKFKQPWNFCQSYEYKAGDY